jgi:hypothetical protein
LSSKTPRTEAEAKFARTQKRATDAARAVSDAAAEAKRIDENTARLRALRLARDAREAAARAVAAAAAAAKPAPAPKGKGKLKPAAKGAGTPAAAVKGKAIPVKKLNARNDG